MGRNQIWAVAVTATVALSGVLVRKGLDEAWRLARHEDPPKDPTDSSVSWTNAVLWTVATGVAVGLGRLVARRGAAAGWHRMTGKAPPT